jgi:hypothetical protein
MHHPGVKVKLQGKIPAEIPAEIENEQIGNVINKYARVDPVDRGNKGLSLLFYGFVQ